MSYLLAGPTLDRIGVLSSKLCMVHCALVAFAPQILVSLGLGALLGHEYEWMFTLLAAGMAGMALQSGYRKHRSFKIAGLFLVGILALFLSRGIEGMAHHHEEGHHEGEAIVAEEHHEESAAGTDDHHGEEAEGLILLGTMVGIFGGACLIWGHVQNIRALKYSNSGPMRGAA